MTELAAENYHASSVPDTATVWAAAHALYPGAVQRCRQRSAEGLDNHLFEVSTSGGEKLLRISDAANAATLHRKELLCAAQARAYGVETLCYDAQATLEQWSVLGRDYLQCATEQGGVTETTTACSAAEREAADWRAAWQRVGEFAVQLHGISIAGYGYDPLLEAGCYLSRQSGEGRYSWSHWVDSELAILTADQSLVAAEVLTKTEYAHCVEVVRDLCNWQFDPALCHGDLSLANILCGEDGVYRLIDWGNAIAHRAPHFDLAEIAVWQESTQWIDGFAAGYGLEVVELEQLLAESIPLQLWRLLWAIRRDICRMPRSWKSAPYARRSVRKLHGLVRQS